MRRVAGGPRAVRAMDAALRAHCCPQHSAPARARTCTLQPYAWSCSRPQQSVCSFASKPPCLSASCTWRFRCVNKPLRARPPARLRAVPKDGGELHHARQERLLRRHHLPPRHQGLHVADGRPAGCAALRTLRLPPAPPPHHTTPCALAPRPARPLRAVPRLNLRFSGSAGLLRACPAACRRWLR